MTAKKNPGQVIKDIMQQTRKLFSAEEKIRIVWLVIKRTCLDWHANWIF